MKYNVAFIVLNWKNEDETIECVNSLRALDGNNKIQIIVVDNGSTKNSFDVLSNLLNVDIIRNERNLGFTGGVNSGLKIVNATYVALVNNDMVIDANWLKAGLRVFKNHKNVAAVGGKEYAWDEKNPVYDETNEFVSAPIVNTRFGFPQSTSRPLNEQRVSSLMGGNVLFDSKKLLSVAGLDDDFFAYCEETDLCMRMLAKKWDIYYSPDMKVWHKRNLTSNRVPFLKIYLSQRNKQIFIAKHFESRRWKQMVLRSIAENIAFAILGTGDGLRGVFAPAKYASLTERRAYLTAGLWGLTHFRYLSTKRKLNIAAGEFNDDLSAMLILLQG